MITAIWILLGLAIMCWILSFISACLGGCQIGLGEEYWKNSLWENIYYKFLAPAGVICVLIAFILCVIQTAT